MGNASTAVDGGERVEYTSDVFGATYLGHQGWLVESGESKILVDPILGDGLHFVDDDCVRIYPPRRFDFAAFPAVDGVIVSHEHPDHLNLPSLLRLDRSIPIYLSARASCAAFSILEELGFRVTLLHSGATVRIGDLEIHPFHTVEITRDEWDVVPLLIRDRAGHGSLATSVDAPESDAFGRFTKEHHGRPALWVSSHNHMDLFAVREGGKQERAEATIQRLADEFVRRVKRTFSRDEAPEVIALLETGFSFARDLEWMNAHVFPGRMEKVAPLVGNQLPDWTLRSPLPGHTFEFVDHRLVNERPNTSFLDVRERNLWPARGSEAFRGPVPDYEPISGREEFEGSDLDTLMAELNRFAEYLYGRELHRVLYTSGSGGGDMPYPRVGMSLRTSSAPIIVEYRPERCAFELVSGVDARKTFAIGMECWANDLLGVLRLDIPSGYLMLGRYRKWSGLDVRAELDAELVLYTHPLRQPWGTLRAYRDLAARLQHGGPRVEAQIDMLNRRRVQQPQGAG